jgi:hypothetical protein
VRLDLLSEPGIRYASMPAVPMKEVDHCRFGGFFEPSSLERHHEFAVGQSTREAGEYP